MYNGCTMLLVFKSEFIKKPHNWKSNSFGKVKFDIKLYDK